MRDEIATLNDLINETRAYRNDASKKIHTIESQSSQRAINSTVINEVKSKLTHRDEIFVVNQDHFEILTLLFKLLLNFRNVPLNWRESKSGIGRLLSINTDALFWFGYWIKQ